MPNQENFVYVNTIPHLALISIEFSSSSFLITLQRSPVEITKLLAYWHEITQNGICVLINLTCHMYIHIVRNRVLSPFLNCPSQTYNMIYGILTKHSVSSFYPLIFFLLVGVRYWYYYYNIKILLASHQTDQLVRLISQYQLVRLTSWLERCIGIAGPRFDSCQGPSCFNLQDPSIIIIIYLKNSWFLIG